MKKILISVFFLLAAHVQVSSQTWTRMQSWGSDFEDIYWIDEQKGVIVGDQLITYTEDAGGTWREVLQKFDFRFSGVTFLDANRGIAVGEKGKIYLTQDAGRSWTAQNSGTAEDLTAIKRTRSGVLFIIGANGLVLRSANQGSTWTKLNLGITSELYSISIPHEDSVWIGSETGRVFFSANKGNTWSSISTPFSASVAALVVEKSGQWLLAGPNGIAAKSDDFGKTVSLFNLGTTADLTDIRSFPPNPSILLVAASDGKVHISTDSGGNFASVNYGTEQSPGFSRISISPDNRIFAVGKSGSLIRSVNEGRTWTTALMGRQSDFVTLDMESANYGFFGGSDGKIFLTTNGANSLINRSLPEPGRLFSLEFWNTNFGYATTNSGVIYRTSNAGQLWVKREISTSNDIKGIHIFLASFPYVVGANGTIARSSGSSGDSWEVFGPNNTQSTADINDISAYDLQTAFAVGDGGKILWSNNGSIWESIPTGTTADLHFTTRINGTSSYAVGDSGTALKSTDLGRTWRLINTGVSENLYGVDFFGDDFAIAVGENGLAIVSDDGGETWTKLETGTLQDLYAAFAFGPNDAIAAGKNGTIIKYNCLPPSGRLSTITGPTETCVSTQMYTITDQPESGSNLTWRVDGGTILAGQGTNQIEVLWGNSGRGGVFVNRSNFCGSGETSFIEVKVEASPASTLQIEGSGVGCLDEVGTFSTVSLENHEYKWSVTGGVITEGQNTPTIKVTWTEPGLHTVALELANRCGNTTLSQLPIQIGSAPELPAPIVGEQTVGLTSEVYETVNVPGLDYQWSISAGGKILTGQGTSRIIVAWEQEGNQTLSVKSQNECDFGPEQFLAVTVSVITSIEPKVPESAIRIYPNPSSGSATLESPYLGQFSSLTLVNSLGQTVHTRTIFPTETHIYLVSLPRGLNFAVLEGKSGRVIKKILVK